MIPEAWVTYANAPYIGVMRVLIRSLAEFSTRPVLVYAVNDDFDATGLTNVVDVRRIDSQEHILTLKIDAMLDAATRAERLIFLDADIVANYSIDEAWSYFAKQKEHPELPSFADHPPMIDNPVVLLFEQKTGEKIARPLGCTGILWYTAECVPMLEEARALKKDVERCFHEMGDMLAINAIASRHGLMVNDVPFCVPIYPFSEYYMARQPPYPAMRDTVEAHYHLFHGGKDAGIADALLDKLRAVRLPVHYPRHDVAPIEAVQVLVTTACDRRCPDCCQGIPRKAPGQHATWAEFEHAAKYLGGYPLTVCGGEPTIHPEFPRIAREFKALFRSPQLVLMTNGYKVIEYGDVMDCFDMVRITNYPRQLTQDAIAWAKEHIPGKCQPEVSGHIPLTDAGIGKPCFRRRTPIYWQGLLYPCCVATGFEGAECIPLSADWEERIVSVPLPCDRCVFSSQGE